MPSNIRVVVVRFSVEKPTRCSLAPDGANAKVTLGFPDSDLATSESVRPRISALALVFGF
ncbi:unannotated protein [freshwater metagenome]|uniref:Unannotated protein n=1 Tax=freshwater metagenome TaxID=449393 RepID=A0A6J6W7Z7_9ZZZZ